MHELNQDQSMVPDQLNHSDKSIELNARDYQGKTALMHAEDSHGLRKSLRNHFPSKSTSEDIVKLLLEHL